MIYFFFNNHIILHLNEKDYKITFSYNNIPVLLCFYNFLVGWTIQKLKNGVTSSLGPSAAFLLL